MALCRGGQHDQREGGIDVKFQGQLCHSELHLFGAK